MVCWSSWWRVYGFSGGAPVRAGLPASGAERPQRLRGGRVDLRLVDGRARAAEPGGVLGRVQARPAAEDQQVGQRVAAEPVGAVHAAGHLAGREQPGHPARRRGVRSRPSTPPIT